MTTELLFRDDAYLRSATARVVAVGERGIELDRTVFYPQGGGQMGDTGVLLRANGETIAIADTRKGDAFDSVRACARAGCCAARRRRDSDPRDRLGATLRADAPAHGAARAFLRRRRPGDRRATSRPTRRASISTST